MEAAAVLAVLLPSVHLRLRPGYIPVPKLRVTLRPAHGMPMRLSRAVDAEQRMGQSSISEF